MSPLTCAQASKAYLGLLRGVPAQCFSSASRSAAASGLRLKRHASPLICSRARHDASSLVCMQPAEPAVSPAAVLAGRSMNAASTPALPQQTGILRSSIVAPSHVLGAHGAVGPEPGGQGWN